MHKLRRFGFNAIKESFDRLPTAVCFFDRSGGIVLCNRQMYRLSQYLLNSDMQYLAGDLGGIDADIVLREWEKSIVFRDAERLPAREALYESAAGSGVAIRIRGTEPAGGAADLMYAAMQVCLSNAIQYAQATELIANIWEDGGRYTVLIRNNGKPPEKTITEGGGLSNLRRRIERIGGTMTVQSLPEFALVIGIPNRENLEEGNEWLSETY